MAFMEDEQFFGAIDSFIDTASSKPEHYSLIQYENNDRVNVSTDFLLKERPFREGALRFEFSGSGWPKKLPLESVQMAPTSYSQAHLRLSFSHSLGERAKASSFFGVSFRRNGDGFWESGDQRNDYFHIGTKQCKKLGLPFKPYKQFVTLAQLGGSSHKVPTHSPFNLSEIVELPGADKYNLSNVSEALQAVDFLYDSLR